MRAIFLIMVCLLFVGAEFAWAGDDAEFFEKRVRPVLASHCFECHGPQKQKGGLRLDSAQAMMRGGESGAVIVPGDPRASRLLRAVSYEDPDLQMPPRSRLPDANIADLERWIELGAQWPDHDLSVSESPENRPEGFDLQKRRAEHWAWQAISNPSIPKVKDENWPIHDVDRFILARLEAEGMIPAPSANRATLIRRAAFDLTGLPPDIEELDSFLHDDSPEWWEKVVDHYLASPAFGERWGRHWLDLMRYAESYGHEQDYLIYEAWRYRDYVIRAFNADVPYDDFLTEHIAGDLLASPRLNPLLGFNESILGTGFWYLGQATHAPVDVRQDEADRLDNQVDVFSKAFLGMTVSCARCHDHKFDAISAKDYHALWGFLKSSRQQYEELDPQGVIGPTAEQLRALRREAEALMSDGLRKALEPDIATYMMAAREVSSGRAPSLMSVAVAQNLDPERLQNWLFELDAAELSHPEHPMNPWKTLVWDRDTHCSPPLESLIAGVAEREANRPGDSSILFADFSGTDYKGWSVSDQAFGSAPTSVGEWSLMTKEPLDSGLAHSGREAGNLRGYLRSKSFVIEKPEIQYRINASQTFIRLIIDNYTLGDFNDLLFRDMHMLVDTQGRMEWVRQTEDVGLYIGHRAYIEIQDYGDGFAAIDEIRFTDVNAPPPVDNPVLARLIERHHDQGIRSEAEVAEFYESLALESMGGASESGRSGLSIVRWLKKKNLLNVEAPDGRLDEIMREVARMDASLPPPARALTMGEGTPEDASVLIRGSAKSPGELVHRRYLEAVTPPEQSPGYEGSGRLQLARQMLQPTDPLVARVIVNRIWGHLFGRGIVPTPDNFGVLGERPSHPELLDHLASRFREDGWSIKRLIRLIMTSRVYQMQSEPVNDWNERHDPDVTLLHRTRLRRLEAEAVRDSLLAVSGSLKTFVGGPPVNVTMTPFMGGRNPPESGPIDGAGRRSIYIGVRRNYLAPFMLSFDFPVPDSTTGRRNVSNVPAQSLTMMNDPFVRQQAERWAERSNSIRDPRARIEMMYREALARIPSESEVYRSLVFLNVQSRAWSEAGVSSDDAARRSWSDLAQVIFMMKEFIFIS